MRKIAIDYTKCDGCKSCSVACMNAHRQDGDTNIYTLDLLDPKNESRNTIKNIKDLGYKPIFCRHCQEPMCAISCMSGSLVKDEESGFVTYDEDRCAACYMCVMNCPFGVIKPDEVDRVKVIKCDFCKNHDHEPSCVKACPKDAIWVEEVL